jgi:uncharacterized protein (DUF1697 family)
MPRYVAFLRAINVGGHVVKMEVLRTVFAGLGFRKVETFIASGNVIFETRSKDRSALESRIERSLLTSLGYEVATFIRTPAEVEAIATHQAFDAARVAQARALNVGLLKEPLTAAAEVALSRLKTDIDDFHTQGAQVYWICGQSQSESDFSNAVFERTLKVKATFRGLRTMTKLAAKYPS